MRLLAACICTIKSTTCTEFRARESGYAVGIKWSWFGLPQPRCLTNAFVSGYSSSVYLSISPQASASCLAPFAYPGSIPDLQNLQGQDNNLPRVTLQTSMQHHPVGRWIHIILDHLRIWCSFFKATKIMKLQTFSVSTHTRLILGDILLDQCGSM